MLLDSLPSDYIDKDETQDQEYYDNEFWQKSDLPSIEDVFNDLE